MHKRLLPLFVAIVSVLLYNVESAKAFYPGTTFFSQDEPFFLHVVERGQTVYSLSIMYGVTVEEIYRLNPSSENMIKPGEVLKITQVSGSYHYHTIQPQETLFGVAQKYYMKGDDIMAVNPGLSAATFSIGKVIRIPLNKVTTPIQGGNEIQNRSLTNSLLTQVPPVKTVNMINVAMMLPFETRDRAKMVEFLEGYLLALEDLKEEVISVHTIIEDIDSDTRKIPAILKRLETQDIHLLIGGISEDQIKLLSRFSKERGIPYVIPATRSDELYSNPNIFQINTPQPNMYSKASLAFINKYRMDNIIIVTDDASRSNQMEFINCLVHDLNEKRIMYKTVAYGSNFGNDIRLLVSSSQKNIIIPCDDSSETFSKLSTPLKSIIENQSWLSLSLFGYPNWQVYSERYSDDFFRLNTSFYSFFFLDPTSPEMRAFNITFYKNYSKFTEKSYPSFGILGYDIGLFFIRLINKYGSGFQSRINDFRFTGIQTDFNFERVNNWGGFINTNMYFVNYNQSYSITKTIVK